MCYWLSYNHIWKSFLVTQQLSSVTSQIFGFGFLKQTKPQREAYRRLRVKEVTRSQSSHTKSLFHRSTRNIFVTSPLLCGSAVASTVVSQHERPVSSPRLAFLCCVCMHLVTCPMVAGIGSTPSAIMIRGRGWVVTSRWASSYETIVCQVATCPALCCDQAFL